MQQQRTRRDMEGRMSQSLRDELLHVVGEIGRLQAIEQELRSRSQSAEKLDHVQVELKKERERVSQLEQQLESRDVQIRRLKKDVDVRDKRIREVEREVEQMLREKEEVQLKADDSFSTAMDQLVQKEKLLELKAQEVRERENQLKEQAGAVWAREQHVWELEQQIHKRHQEYYQKQQPVVQEVQMPSFQVVEQQQQQQQQKQTFEGIYTPFEVEYSGHVVKEEVAPEGVPQSRAPQTSQIDSWNAKLPLLDEDVLISLIKQFDSLTVEDRAKFDKFLLPHSWSTHYQPIYGPLEDFFAKHYHQQKFVVTPMPMNGASQSNSSSSSKTNNNINNNAKKSSSRKKGRSNGRSNGRANANGRGSAASKKKGGQ